MRGAIDERRHARAARKASRDEDGGMQRQRRPSLISDSPSASPKTTGKCKKHSKCHCFLFSLDSVEFYAVGNGEDRKGSD